MTLDWRRTVFVLTVLMAASVLGIGSALFAVRMVADVESTASGPWRTHATYGEASPTPWLRTAQAMTGLFALPKEQALLFTAFTDSEGQRLDAACAYRLTGAPPAGDWWSLTLYGRGQFLLPGPEKRWSVDAGSVETGHDGGVEIAIGGPSGAANGISTGGAEGSFSLTLRVYGPEAGAGPPGGAPLFRIEREACA